LLNASEGFAIINPSAAELEEGARKRAEWLEERAAAARYLHKDCATKDGVRVSIGLNIGSDKDEIPDYVDFVGLFRTEFLYMHSSHLPAEEEQYAAYRRVLERAGGRPVTLRTIDIGGDKTLPYLPLPEEANPFLGARAIRLCFARPDLLITQLRAAYRASVYGNLRIMFPMVSNAEDIRRAKAIAAEARAGLQDVATAQVPLGVMIEIPAAAVMADEIAAEVDFASIGTNDLCQYLFAADRMNPAVSEYNNANAPAMLRLLRIVSDAFRDAGKPLSVCGEMAGQPAGALALVKLGIRKLSMSEGCVARVKAELAGVSLS
jgi:phosphotransferase system enzyme I (PtsI)